MNIDFDSKMLPIPRRPAATWAGLLPKVYYPGLGLADSLKIDNKIKESGMKLNEHPLHDCSCAKTYPTTPRELQLDIYFDFLLNYLGLFKQNAEK